MKCPGAWCRLRAGQPAGAVVLLGAALLMSACADDPAPILDPDLEGTMSLAPASATPGQEVAMRFPADSQRGIAFSLSQWSDSQWKQTYYLTSDWGTSGDHTPTWWTVDDSDNRGWEQVGVSGPGPDRVLIPDTAPPGDYLLCTANARDEACAQLAVTD